MDRPDVVLMDLQLLVVTLFQVTIRSPPLSGPAPVGTPRTEEEEIPHAIQVIHSRKV